MPCGSHTEAETSLRCSKCGKLICPKCMVETPVGSRCRQCARVSRLPTYSVGPAQYFKATAAGLVAALVIGYAWSWVGRLIPFLFLDLIIAPLFGYALAEAIGAVVNRKRGTGLAAIGAVCMLIAYAVNLAFFRGLPFGALGILSSLIALALGIVAVVNRLR